MAGSKGSTRGIDFGGHRRLSYKEEPAEVSNQGPREMRLAAPKIEPTLSTISAIYQQSENSMNNSNIQKCIIFYLRMTMAWTFLYAGLSQVIGNFSASGFLNATKTFHGFYILFASPQMLPYTDFLVRWGHTLIRCIASIWNPCPRQRGFWNPAADNLLLCSYGLSLRRWWDREFHHGLPFGLRRRARLSDQCSGWAPVWI